jgi:branched-subunit amino acid ABC-type transport system permease component
MLLLLVQSFNGLQFGVMLFLMAAGLTLVFGIMNVVNLAHGSLYMIGAYVCAETYVATGSFALAIPAGLLGAVVTGLVIEIGIFRSLYTRDHLDQVLATFGLTLFFNDLVRLIWGPDAVYATVPRLLAGQIEIIPGAPYPAYRLAIIVVGLVVAALLYVLITHTRFGMVIRAGASNRVMASALGANIVVLYTVVFVLGALLAGLAGLMAGPIFTVASGMGDSILILAFVVIVIGGIGSIRGAFIAALAVGFIDTMGRAYLRPLFGLFMPSTAADNAGPAVASMLIYIAMAAVLFFRPQGLFPPRMR